MIHRYYAPVQLLALSPILYLTVQKGTPSSAGPLKVRGPTWSNRLKTGPALFLPACHKVNRFVTSCLEPLLYFLHLILSFIVLTVRK